MRSSWFVNMRKLLTLSIYVLGACLALKTVVILHAYYESHLALVVSTRYATQEHVSQGNAFRVPLDQSPAQSSPLIVHHDSPQTSNVASVPERDRDNVQSSKIQENLAHANDHFNTNRNQTEVFDISYMHRPPSPGLESGETLTFEDMVLDRASKDKVIYLASVDYGYIDMAFNLYETSFLKHKIENFLFAGSDPEACALLKRNGIACVTHILDKDAKSSSRFKSLAFKRKTHIKTKIVLDSLKLGLTTILTDVDIVFAQDPGPHMTCSECDLEITDDINDLNSGFFIARPTPASLSLFQESWDRGVSSTNSSNQVILNRVINEMGSRLKMKVLNKRTFINGKEFFRFGGRYFKGDHPCPSCVIIHNNWIVGLPAKIYRFKEYGLWDVDRDGYYSSLDHKYLTFDLPDVPGEERTCARQMAALRTAFMLGDLLHRFVILPRFRSVTRTFTISPYCSIDKSLDRYQANKYRESVFLAHDKVPDKVKKSVSPKYLIRTNSSYVDDLNSNVTMRTPQSITEGPTIAELETWFKDSQYYVLRFHSLFDRFLNPDVLNLTSLVKLRTSC